MIIFVKIRKIALTKSDILVNLLNKQLDMRKSILSLIITLAAAALSQAQETEIRYLSGKGNDSMTEWDFYCTAGRNSGVWTKIGVPSCWECQGFGEYNYGHFEPSKRLNESGRYRYRFDVPAGWKGKEIRIVFGAVATDAAVRINGKSAGEKHQGGYYQFSYDITSLVKTGRSNLLEVDVDKSSADKSVNWAEREVVDFWIYGGIYRPVWLEARPASNIDRIALDAGADGHLSVDVYLGGKTSGAELQGQLFTADGRKFGDCFKAACGSKATDTGATRMEADFDSPALWTAETPNLYSLQLSLVKDGRTIHTISQKFGFRTVEIRPEDGIYVNGRKIFLKGVDRHSHWPTSGRTLNDRINLDDALLIKEMNMNAVRMSHYPPEPRFLEVCDSLGLYVLDELLGWWGYYDTPVGLKLAKETVIRDVNHPSVIIWDNGNETGFNYDLDDEFMKWDPQKRLVIHPFSTEELVSTHHYANWWWTDSFLNSSRKLFFPTEALHGLYDGGHGAGLEEYWARIMASPNGVGCFLWDLVDQGLVRDDQGGRLDTDGDHGADGILGPYREKEGSFYTIKDVWSPVQLVCGNWLPKTFDGRIKVENRYSFTNLSECRFNVSFVKYDFVKGEEAEMMPFPVKSPDVEPGLSGYLDVVLPFDFQSYDAMKISAFGPDGREIYTWTKTIRKADEFAQAMLEEDKKGSEAVSGAVLIDGRLAGLRSGDKTLPLTGCRFAMEHRDEDGDIKITDLPGGWTEVSYSFNASGKYDNIGVTFDFPEDKIKGMNWIGGGPYRVWKNRLRGSEFGWWHKSYNDTMTGESWDYPEFKGYHSRMYAADIDTEYGILRILFATDNLFLHMLTPKSSNKNTNGIFPEGQISVLNAISPIGTKFTDRTDSGPEGLKTDGASRNLRENAPIGRFYMKFIPR